MTCLVAVKDGKKVYLGADSSGSDDDSGVILNYEDKKVFIRNGYLIGYAGSYRFGKLLEYVFELPDIPSSAKDSKSLDKFVNGTLMPSLRKQSKDLDLSPDELDFDCIFAIKGHIFEISNGWFGIEPSVPYLASGSGTKYALGSLYTTKDVKDPEERVLLALQSAAEFSMSVAGPFTILSK